MFLSVIVPVYNEQETLNIRLQCLLQLKLDGIVDQHEIIVVDDCSRDDSCRIAESLVQENNNLRLFGHVRNLGKGSAVRTGVHHAKGNMILVCDADLELATGDIYLLVEAMNQHNASLVNGSRYLPGPVRKNYPFWLTAANYMLTKLTGLFLNVHITDAACGYKLFSRELYSKLNLKENRFGFDLEIVIRTLRHNRDGIVEVPVQYNPRNKKQGKKLKFTDGVRIFWVVIKYGLLRIS